MLENNNNKSLDPRNKKAIRIAFLIKEKRFEDAQRELELLKNDFKQVPPFEVNIMDSYVTLLMGPKDKKFDKRHLEDSTEKACKSFDGVNCWLSLELMSWENLGKTLTRNEPIFSDSSMSIDALKEEKSITPLKETTTINQTDIEELDGQLIDIMKAIPKE